MHWITIIGILLTMGGTILTYYGTTISNNETNQNLTSEIRKKDGKIDELIEGKNDLLAANTKLDNSIQNYQKDLKIKQKKIQELEHEIDELHDFELTEKELEELGNILSETIKHMDSSFLSKIYSVKFPGQSQDGARLVDQIENLLARHNYPKLESPTNLAIKSTKDDGKEWNGIIIQISNENNPHPIAQALLNFCIKNHIRVWTIVGQYDPKDSNSMAFYAHKPDRI